MERRLGDAEYLAGDYSIADIAVFPWVVRTEWMDITKGQQFAPEFLAISPNNKIPAIVDTDGPGGEPLSLFESGAILMYLADKAGSELLPADPVRSSLVIQWLMFQMGGVGPMFGQYLHFHRYAKQRVPYGVKRYGDEVRPLARCCR